MEGRTSTFEELLDDFVKRLPDTTYVAVDLELTGTDIGGEPDSYSDLPTERLEKLCRIAEFYAPIQIGLTLVSAQAGSAPVYTVTTYNVLSFPFARELQQLEEVIDDIPAALKFVRKHGVDLNACMDDEMAYINRWDEEQRDASAASSSAAGGAQHGLQKADLLRLWQALCSQSEQGAWHCCRPDALRFVRRHGVDLNAWVDEGVPYRHPANGAGGRGQGLSRLWEALRNARKPLVVHTPLDLFFLLAAFEERPLPRQPHLLASLIGRCFPHVYDTAHLQSTVPCLRRRSCGLAGLFQAAEAAHEQMVRDRRRPHRLDFRLEERTRDRYGSAENSVRADCSHEAGCDSLLTAQLLAYVWSMDPPAVSTGIDRLFLFRSTECLDLQLAACTGRIVRSIYIPMRETLLVASLSSDDMRREVARTISDSSDNTFYRQMDDRHLLVVIDGCGAEAVERAGALSKKVQGIHWLTFDAWRRSVRGDVGASQDTAVQSPLLPPSKHQQCPPGKHEGPPGKHQAPFAPQQRPPPTVEPASLPAVVGWPPGSFATGGRGGNRGRGRDVMMRASGSGASSDAAAARGSGRERTSQGNGGRKAWGPGATVYAVDVDSTATPSGADSSSAGSSRGPAGHALQFQ